MIPRGVLDLSQADWRFAARQCTGGVHLAERDVQTAATEVERAWDPSGRTLACLSVRSGWDLALQALAWPPGSEVLMSAVTIRNMAGIVRRHGLVPVPLDVDPRTLFVDLDQLQSRFSPRTKGVLVAHLFGSRTPLGELAAWARERGVFVIEDAAQAYAALGDRSDVDADLRCFSFGPIKTQTALGGGVIEVRDPELLERMRRMHAAWPRQTVADFRRRLRRFSWLHRLSRYGCYTAMTSACRLSGIDYDRHLSHALRGFGGGGLLEKIRRQPSLPLMRLLRRRIEQPDREWLVRKSRLASTIREGLPAECRLGDAAHFPVHWVLPIQTNNPDETCRRLRAAGFDATRHASNMAVIETPAERLDAGTPWTSRWVSRLVYLPLHPALTDDLASRLAELAG